MIVLLLLLLLPLLSMWMQTGVDRTINSSVWFVIAHEGAAGARVRLCRQTELLVECEF